MKLLFDDAENVEKHLLKGLFFRKIEAPPLKSIKQSFSKTEINVMSNWELQVQLENCLKKISFWL